jgi:phosphatidylglycerol:prolipoprotein diacylglycerol transferase
VLAAYLHNLSPFLFEIRPGLGPRWYGLSYVLAFGIGYLLYRWLAQRRYTEMPPSQVGDFITWAALFGVMLGGRIGWMLFYGVKQDHTGDPWWWPLQVWKGGMSSHGGILGLVLFTLWYARRHRLSWTSIGDSLCVVAPIGLFLVRCANFINGELYGKAAAVPWAVQFPQELHDDIAMFDRVAVLAGRPEIVRVDSLIEAARSDQQLQSVLSSVLTPRHPSQLYEALLEGVVLFLVLWLLRTRFRVPRGVITGAFFILYAVLRIIGEIYRVPDPAWSVGVISAGQFLSIFLVLIGAAFLLWAWKTHQYEQAQTASADAAR